ncbi:MAG: peptidoglycan recognition family protein [Phycisphaerales bacterium]
MPRKSSKSSSNRKQSVSPRTKKVFGSLLVAMTGVGGLLLMLNGRPAPSGKGFALTPLMAVGRPETLESIYQTVTPVEDGRWLAIVVHDSGRASGNPDSLEAEARAMKLKNGLGYHFVIGNGNGMPDGELFVGERWRRQTSGAHVAGSRADWFNHNSIGICLVGDGNRRAFTEEQLGRLRQLINSLCQELKVPADHVYLHSQLARTSSPGIFFPETAFRESLSATR